MFLSIRLKGDFHHSVLLPLSAVIIITGFEK
ncbi:hypothetical protein HNR69_001680 [Histophilus somni]|nr:hypothetical protein [Histophilus somni]